MATKKIKKSRINKKYDYFAIRKIDSKIANGWEIIDDVESLKYYAKQDLKDNDQNPKDYNIVSKRFLLSKKINPFDENNWVNDKIGAIMKKKHTKKAAKKSTLKTPPVYMSKRQTGTSNKDYDKRKKALPPGKRISANTGNAYYEYRKNRTDKAGSMLGIGKMFDTTIIKDLDSLKKQYHKLALKYHPDAGGTHEQFLELQKEYDKLIKDLLKGSNLNKEQQDNELKIDEELRKIIDAIVTIPDLDIELKGKWIWLKGKGLWIPEVKNLLYSLGFPPPFKKEGIWYRIYKGVESASRGKTTMEEINAKYGNVQFATKKPKEINGLGKLPTNKKSKFKTAFRKLVNLIKKRPA